MNENTEIEEMIGFKDILYMPVDLPKFDMCNELVADFNKEFTPHSAQAFESQRLLEPNKNYGISKPRADLTESQAAMLEYINEHLPFTDLVNIKIHHMRRQGSIHIDFVEPKNNKELYKHNKKNEPCGYRMVIQGSRQGDLAIITNDHVIKQPILPEDTDWYTIRHTETAHANTKYVDDRYILFCHGWIDPQKNEELLNKSLSKYKNVDNAVVYGFEHSYQDDWIQPSKDTGMIIDKRLSKDPNA